MPEKRFSGFVGSRGKRYKYDETHILNDAGRKRFASMGFVGSRGKRPYETRKRFSGFVGARGKKLDKNMKNSNQDVNGGNTKLQKAMSGVMAYLQRYHHLRRPNGKYHDS